LTPIPAYVHLKRPEALLAGMRQDLKPQRGRAYDEFKVVFALR